jgi:membrane-bound acyltransferase YfiQ involved in biofilm formation
MNKRTTIIAGIIGLIGWFFTFGLGLFIASKPYRDQLLQSFQWKAFLVSLFTYTPTNIAALCLLAAFTGGCASQLIISAMRSPQDSGNKEKPEQLSDTQIYMQESPVSSMLRGFVVYVAFLAGVYITSNAPFADPTQEQYARAAGTTSLLAFVVGYDPTIFRQLINLGAKLKG